MFKQIVVGVDGREGGRDAVALAKLLVAAGGELTLAHVVPAGGRDRGASAAYEAPEAEQAEIPLQRVGHALEPSVVQLVAEVQRQVAVVTAERVVRGPRHGRRFAPPSAQMIDHGFAHADPATVDFETRATADDHMALRLWLRLLACSNLIEVPLKILAPAVCVLAGPGTSEV